MTELRTERLILRQWRESDLAPFARLNGDAEVMEHFPETLTRERSDRGARAAKAAIERHGHGFWAVEIPGEADFIGFVGLQEVHEDVPFVPAVEIGWRLDKPFWGRGLAYEGAQATVAFAFDELKLAEVVAYTAESNVRSRRLMERLGMTHDPAEDFDHQKVPTGHPARRHVVYRLANTTR